MRTAMLGILERDHPQSVRHVFYRMTDPRLDCAVDKSESGYRQVQHQLAEMRKRGLLPYGWIVDATRRGHFVTTFASASDFIRRMAGHYRADAWRHARAYVEVWCESRSIAAVVQRDCEELGVSLYPSGGFASLTLLYEAAEQIAAEGELTKPRASRPPSSGVSTMLGWIPVRDLERPRIRQMERRTAMAMTDSMPIDALNDLQAANSARGEAVAFIDVAGYRLKLGFDRLKWLLQDERWRRCGFDTIDPCGAQADQRSPSVKALHRSKNRSDSGTAGQPKPRSGRA